MTDSSLSSPRSLSIRERNPKIHTKYSHPPPCWADQRPSNGGHSTECQVKLTVWSMTQHQAWVRRGWFRRKPSLGEHLLRFPGGQVLHWRTRDLVTDDELTWHGSSWHPGDRDTDVMMSRCHGHLNTSTVRQFSVTEPHLHHAALFVCLYLHLSGRCLDLLYCLCFLEILFGQSNNNNVDPSLPRNSP